MSGDSPLNYLHLLLCGNADVYFLCELDRLEKAIEKDSGAPVRRHECGFDELRNCF